jgi:heme exporter protein CcmD
MMHWLSMGGYWRYVWPCYLLTAAALALNVYLARRAFTSAVREVRRRAAASRSGS